MNNVPYLCAGDRVALCATARAVSPDEMAAAIAELNSWGLEVVVPDGLYERDGQLAGTDEHRAAVMQRLLDAPDIKAIVCCRGGYGTVRIVDRLDFAAFAQRPKWVVGYSDVTVLHSHIGSSLHIPTLHATMPVNFGPQPTAATRSLRSALFGETLEYSWSTHPLTTLHTAVAAPVVGGNLSILYSLLGSHSQLDTRGKILLVEDLDEYLYHIDRMMQALHRAGMLSGVGAILVGGMTDMHDNQIPFGLDAEQIVARAAADAGCPVVFGAPFGHLGADNMALPLGREAELTVDGDVCTLRIEP